MWVMPKHIPGGVHCSTGMPLSPLLPTRGCCDSHSHLLTLQRLHGCLSPVTATNQGF